MAYDEPGKNNILPIIISIVCFLSFVLFLTELIIREPEIILTKEGLELRHIGFFTWDMIESYSTFRDRRSENLTEYLALHFKDNADVTFEIEELEIDKNELVDLITKFKGSANIYFAGHNLK